MIYTHVLRLGGGAVRSPLDKLGAAMPSPMADAHPGPSLLPKVFDPDRAAAAGPAGPAAVPPALPTPPGSAGHPGHRYPAASPPAGRRPPRVREPSPCYRACPATPNCTAAATTAS
jgi:hypothetical protein